MQILAIKRAAEVIFNGGVIAYPTEAVWGLGCDPDNEQACLKLLQIKQRPVEKGMILIAGSLEQFSRLLAPLASRQRETLAQAWQRQNISGAVTFLVPDLMNQVPWWVKGQHSAVALRVSRHPLVKALCEMSGGALVSTSANISGRPPARSLLTLKKQLGAQLDFIVPGCLGGESKPSRIIDLETGKILRTS
ncbi:MAG: Sua5/YciO/YrdC/YwlC family protein [Gammaproteobacteria bacterium]|nr:Sua5/YciO/YrdC/YwlC family protein [Gammaproteobacteria bacterium]